MFKNIIRQLFARLNRHLPHRLIRRDSLPNVQTVVNMPIPPSLNKHCLKMVLVDEEALWKTFDVHPEDLNTTEVENAREIHGGNQLPTQKPSSWRVHL